MAGQMEPKLMRPGWVAALIVASIATVAALVLQNLVRDIWQVRTLPERVMEWLLLFVPLDAFERGLAQLGSDAKEVALTGTVVGMVGLLVAIGAPVLHAGWSGWRVLAIGPGLWLLTMLVVMPVTGAGLFAT